MTGGLEPEYTLTAYKADEWLRKYVEAKEDVSAAPAAPDLWESQNIETMRRIGDVYVKQHESSKYHVVRASFIVTAHCLLKTHEPMQGPDLVQYQVVFETLDDPVYCQSMSLNIAEGSKSRGMATVRIVGPDPGIPITPTLIPMTKPNKNISALGIDPEKVTIRQLVVFFDPVLPARTGPYTLTLEEWVDNAMSPLQNKGEDNLFIERHIRASGTIDRTDLVLNVPKSFGEVQADPTEPNCVLMPDDMKEEYGVLGGLFNTIGCTCVGADPAKPVELKLRRHK